ncbi:MAG TPA: hypothetical protein VGH40_24840 [Roseiarcus sp.]
MASLAARRQHDADDAAMQPLLGVMIDRGSEVLKIAASATALTLVGPSFAFSPSLVGSALRSGDLIEREAPEEIEQPLCALPGLGGICLVRSDVG